MGAIVFGNASRPGGTGPHIPGPADTATMQPPVLKAAAFNVTAVDGDISAINGSFNIGGSAYLMPGMYLLLFSTPLPSDNYFVTFSGGSPCMNDEEKAVDYIIVTAKDAPGGELIDPQPFSVQVWSF